MLPWQAGLLPVLNTPTDRTVPRKVAVAGIHSTHILPKHTENVDAYSPPSHCPCTTLKGQKLCRCFSETVTGTGQQQLHSDTWEFSRETKARSSSTMTVEGTIAKQQQDSWWSSGQPLSLIPVNLLMTKVRGTRNTKVTPVFFPLSFPWPLQKTDHHMWDGWTPHLWSAVRVNKRLFFKEIKMLTWFKGTTYCRTALWSAIEKGSTGWLGEHTSDFNTTWTAVLISTKGLLRAAQLNAAKKGRRKIEIYSVFSNLNFLHVRGNKSRKRQMHTEFFYLT